MTSTRLGSRIAALALSLLLATAFRASAQVPGSISYQGRLLDATGAPVSSSVTMAFGLYAQANSTVTIWTETHTVTPINGFFTVHLGDINEGGKPFGAGVWTGEIRYLGIQVAGDAEMSPRAKLLSAPYALLAAPIAHAHTHQLGGGDEVGTTTVTPNQIPVADSSGRLAPGWLPSATTTASGVVLLAADAAPSGVVQGGDSRLTNSRLPLPHAASHQSGGPDEIAMLSPTVNGIPKADGNHHLDPGWIGTVAVASGGTGSISPRITRNLCFFLAGPPPTSLAQAPTLQVPPDLSNCTIVQAYGSVAVAPTSAATWSFQKVSGTGGGLIGGTWTAGSNAASGGTGNTALTAADVIAPVFSSSSAGISNATVCLQILCGVGFQ